jgi:hypothetical protein
MTNEGTQDMTTNTHFIVIRTAGANAREDFPSALAAFNRARDLARKHRVTVEVYRIATDGTPFDDVLLRTVFPRPSAETGGGSL